MAGSLVFTIIKYQFQVIIILLNGHLNCNVKSINTSNTSLWITTRWIVTHLIILLLKYIVIDSEICMYQIRPILPTSTQMWFHSIFISLPAQLFEHPLALQI